MDDPFLPERAVPHEEVAENPWLLASFPPRGGHVGFVEKGSLRQPTFWAESEAIRYLADILKVPAPG
jgi:predicted alpha/beta-fold hydrolase